MTGYFQPPGQPFAPGTALGYGPKGPSDDQLLALLAYLLTFVASLIAPLIIYLVKMNESRYVRFHAAQSLNMGLTALIYSFSGFLIGIAMAIATHPSASHSGLDDCRSMGATTTPVRIVKPMVTGNARDIPPMDMAETINRFPRLNTTPRITAQNNWRLRA